MMRWTALMILAGVTAFGLLAWPAAPAETGTQRAQSLYAYPYPDAPDCDERTHEHCVLDAWGMSQGQCTSWAAFRLNTLLHIGFDRRYRGVRWGDAGQWAHAATAAGLTVDRRPAIGAVAWWPSVGAGTPGHVAVVENVLSPGRIVLSELNVDGHNEFRIRTVTLGGDDGPIGFIHFGELGAGAALPTPSPDREVHPEGSVLISEPAGRLLDAVQS